MRGSYQTIWSFPLTDVEWHSMTWPYTMTTPYWSDFVPNSTFYRILSGFHRTFATVVACWQGTLTPPDTWSRPFGTYICSTCWDQSFFPNLSLFFLTMLFEYPSVLFRFCFLRWLFPQWSNSSLWMLLCLFNITEISEGHIGSLGE